MTLARASRNFKKKIILHKLSLSKLDNTNVHRKLNMKTEERKLQDLNIAMISEPLKLDYYMIGKIIPSKSFIDEYTLEFNEPP